MKKELIINEGDDLRQLNPILQRLIVVTRQDIHKYCKLWMVISDLDGRGWYAAMYNKGPYLNASGQVYYKTLCDWSGTYRSGKFYGDKLLIQGLLKHLIDYIPQFEFLKTCRMVGRFPDYAVKAILDGKITSQEEVYKLIAHRSYKDKHWKIVKMCLQQGFSPMRLQMACKDYESIINTDIIEHCWEFDELIKYAIITGTKVSCKWSQRRIEEELNKLKRVVTSVEIEMKDNTPIYKLPETTPLHIVNTERDAFLVSGTFHNCVYRKYWPRIRDHKYFVAYDDKYCIGYQIIEDDNHDYDLIFDQLHTDYNGNVDTITTGYIDSLIRPILYDLLKQIQRIPKLTAELPF